MDGIKVSTDTAEFGREIDKMLHSILGEFEKIHSSTFEQNEILREELREKCSEIKRLEEQHGSLTISVQHYTTEIQKLREELSSTRLQLRSSQCNQLGQFLELLKEYQKSQNKMPNSKDIEVMTDYNMQHMHSTSNDIHAPNIQDDEGNPPQQVHVQSLEVDKSENDSDRSSLNVSYVQHLYSTIRKLKLALSLQRKRRKCLEARFEELNFFQQDEINTLREENLKLKLRFGTGLSQSNRGVEDSLDNNTKNNELDVCSRIASDSGSCSTHINSSTIEKNKFKSDSSEVDKRQKDSFNNLSAAVLASHNQANSQPSHHLVPILTVPVGTQNSIPFTTSRTTDFPQTVEQQYLQQLDSETTLFNNARSLPSQTGALTIAPEKHSKHPLRLSALGSCSQVSYDKHLLLSSKGTSSSRLLTPAVANIEYPGVPTNTTKIGSRQIEISSNNSGPVVNNSMVNNITSCITETKATSRKVAGYTSTEQVSSAAKSYQDNPAAKKRKTMAMSDVRMLTPIYQQPTSEFQLFGIPSHIISQKGFSSTSASHYLEPTDREQELNQFDPCLPAHQRQQPQESHKYAFAYQEPPATPQQSNSNATKGMMNKISYFFYF